MATQSMLRGERHTNKIEQRGGALKHMDERTVRGDKYIDERVVCVAGVGRDAQKRGSWKTHALMECLNKNKQALAKPIDLAYESY